MPSLLIKGGRIIDTANDFERVADLLIENGKITRIADIVRDKAVRTIDATGMIVCAGFIDLHTHLREPGREDKETIQTGTAAAAAGGFTSICPMPNTSPILDRQTGLTYIKSVTKDQGVVNVYPIAAITKGSQGENITEYGDLVAQGAIGFSDDGKPVMNSEIMRVALEYSSMLKVPIMDHCEDENLSKEGMIHEGKVSMKLGLKGIPSACESVIVARDIELAKYTGGHIHICHVSSEDSVDLIKTAKKKKIKVTAEVTPHHLLLNEEALLNFDTNMKMNPPLRTKEDQKALLKALIDGTIDVIATDHAPHTDIEKDEVFIEAPFGVIGLETAFPALYTELVEKNLLRLNKLIECLTTNPASILGIDKGGLSLGASADITIIDPNLEKVVDDNFFQSKSRNSAFLGKKYKGNIHATIVEGHVVYYEGKIIKGQNY